MQSHDCDKRLLEFSFGGWLLKQPLGRVGGRGNGAYFTTLSEQVKGLHALYLPEIQQRANKLHPAEILSMVCGKAAV